jgi:hypothetical protein
MDIRAQLTDVGVRCGADDSTRFVLQRHVGVLETQRRSA